MANLDYESSLSELEKNHLLYQPYAIKHFVVHWQMLKLALKYGVTREVLGQIPRLILAIPGSLLGLAPKGNLGSTKMGIFEVAKK